jgi:hypothetical protein
LTKKIKKKKRKDTKKENKVSVSIDRKIVHDTDREESGFLPFIFPISLGILISAQF